MFEVVLHLSECKDAYTFFFLKTLAERLAENAHQVWAKQKKEDLEAIGK